MIYDDFQKKAIEHINEGFSVIVSAPTGAGKTVIAEHVIRECLKRGEKVVYTAPIKALSNQKYREFQKETHGDIGILTGDITLNPQAPLLIMTTEIFRNKILEEKKSLQQFSWIIFDEIHYLDDYERGSVWEESLIFLPEHMKFLGLSATVPNIDELKYWLEGIHRKPIKVVVEHNRPVPLHFYFQCQGEIFDNIEKTIKKGFRGPQVAYNRGGKIPEYDHLKPNRIHPLIGYLAERDWLPCIYFAFSRKKTEHLAEEAKVFNFLTAEEKKAITELFDALCRRFDLIGDDGAKKLLPFVERGIAYHHAGMLPTLKEVVEQLFTSRLLKMIFTTETFALGINMPARSVIFDELRKFYGYAFGILRTRDFYQMAGRAGRRSIDTEGYVFCRVNPHEISADELRRIIYSKPEKVHSQFNASYATLLNLYQHYGEKLYDIYPRSLHYFQTRKFLQKKAMHLLKGKVDILKELGHIKGEKLTPKGIFASNVYGYEIILSELQDRGILEQLSVSQLGILTLAAVYEPRKGVTKPPLHRPIRALEQLTDDIIRKVNRIEKIVGLRDYTKRCHFHLAPAMEHWMRQQSFPDILQYTDADEGEIVRYLRMTIQVLREMCGGSISDTLKEKAHALIGLINRDVVDSEKQLRS